VWIWFYSFLIVWWTYSVTIALDLHFSVIPMILYPFGISIRDRKKYEDFKLALKLFKDELHDQEISLAETYSGPIFQFTGLLGLAWLLSILIQNENVSFTNSGIQYQAPTLLAVITVKYIALALNKFKTKKCLFWFNFCFYIFFLAVVMFIDYLEEMF